MYITAQGPHLRNDLYCVEWDVKLYYTIPFLPCLDIVGCVTRRASAQQSQRVLLWENNHAAMYDM